ncbi:hypothetical protein Tco_0647883 [Tanacetum coccineum]
MKNNSVCKENGSNVFQKEREQYHEIQDLKAQMQDKNIAISELKKLIEKYKGKSVETQFDKPSVVRQPNAQRIPKPSVLGKPTPFSNSPEMRSFQTKQSVNKTNVSDGSSKQVTQQNLPQNRKQAEIHTNTLTPGMSKSLTCSIACLRAISKISSNSRTSNVNVVCAECGKCVFNSNHDACVSKYLNDVNARTKKPKVVPISASKPKRKTNKSVATPHKKTVASDTTIQKPKSYFKELYENTNKAWKWWIEKKCPSEYKWTQTTPSRPSLKWKPTGRIFSNVRLRWFPQESYSTLARARLTVNPCTSFNGQKQQRIDLNADALYNAKQENLKVWLLKMLISKKPVPECSSLGHQCLMTFEHSSSSLGHQCLMMSDHNSLDLVPQRQEMSVENVSSGLVPQGQKASDYDNSNPVPQDKMLFLQQKRQIRHNCWIPLTLHNIYIIHEFDLEKRKRVSCFVERERIERERDERK